MTIFETKNLLVRHLEQEDLGDLLWIYNNELNMRFVSKGKHDWTMEELCRKVEAVNKDCKFGIGIFIVELKSTGKVIGEAGLFNSFQEFKKLELGYILDFVSWGKGYGKEICSGLLKYGFEELKTETLIARMYAKNIASVKLSEKCGMKRTEEGIAENGERYFAYAKHSKHDL
ncbi:GNAT family N-acetyltransferase [Ancylomarina sp. 16SWW S1-10-2]|uniref:GNAT family N-acetyltransferase n=1 Tax=Ancylomarina sp. 16SWW S1-10-2 TaxID=2499681 RepID=UPI0012ADA4C3|nr:GNAT family N-acetyltransferase [Ancylomarina sp. 16SWW S1-10-2]MRT94359.1 N-acetyltransferase [Ancylomarina sp. 16SWW S1-10-2]